jgi:hypothetical protein
MKFQLLFSYIITSISRIFVPSYDKKSYGNVLMWNNTIVLRTKAETK